MCAGSPGGWPPFCGIFEYDGILCCTPPISDLGAALATDRIQRAHSMAEEKNVRLDSHVTGHAVCDIVALTGELKADLLVVRLSGHSEFL